MDFKNNELPVLIVLVLRVLPQINSQCIVAIQGELQHPHPLILRTVPWSPFGLDPYHIPSKDGDLMFNENEGALLECPGSYIVINGRSYSEPTVEVVCKSYKSFEIVDNSELVQLRQITCNAPPLHTLRRTGRSCNVHHQELEIGFKLSNNVFINQITLCFNESSRATLYEQHSISHRISSAQFGQSRPFFDEDPDVFDLPKTVNALYHIPTQRQTITNAILKINDMYACIDRGSKVLTRGHLAAKGDFIYIAQQTATFHYVNAAPQWKDVNNGNWNELEKSVRSFIGQRSNEFHIYTGTYEIMTFQGKRLHLYVDDQIEAIPVPLYFWKVVYEPRSQRGIAFVSLNDPYHSYEPFCHDICNLLNWHITWLKNDQEQGVSFCCSVEDLRNHVEFPSFPINGLLYI